MRIGTLTEQMRTAMKEDDVMWVPHGHYFNIVVFSPESVQLYAPWHCPALAEVVDSKLMGIIAARNVSFFAARGSDDQWGQIAAASLSYWKTLV